MDFNLTGKKAIISGSTKGIGYAIAKGLAETGASVIINGRSQESIKDSINRLKREVPNADLTGVASDLTNPSEVKQFINQVPHADILINNLGMYEPKSFFEITDEEWERFFQTNVMSAVRLTRHYGRGMVDKGWGRILFNASVTSGFFPGEMVHYGATKAALLGLSRGLAENLANTGVTVNAFLPGPTKTESVKEHIGDFAKSNGKTFAEMEHEMFSEKLPASLLNRFVTPEEVANLVVFLASEKSSAITGSTYRVDGGFIRTIV